MFYLWSVLRWVLICGMFAWSFSTIAAFPDKPITIIVTYSAGGGADVQIRIVARYLEKELGVPVVVRNIVGGGGQTGWDTAAKSRPDGYTWVNLNLPQLISQPAVRETGYTAQSFDPLVMFRDEPSALAVRADNPKSLHELIADAKKQPGKVSMGTTGKWLHTDLALALFEDSANVSFAEVNVEGQTELNRLLLGGHVQAGFGNTSAFYRLTEQLKVLAVAGKKRTPVLPDVPTFEEQGFPGVDSPVTMGLGVPKGTPPDIVNPLSARLYKLFKTNDSLNKDLEKAGGSPWFLMNREESIRLFEEKRAAILKAYKSRGIKIRE